MIFLRFSSIIKSLKSIKNTYDIIKIFQHYHDIFPTILYNFHFNCIFYIFCYLKNNYMNIFKMGIY